MQARKVLTSVSAMTEMGKKSSSYGDGRVADKGSVLALGKKSVQW
jgi:hypothetical protein